MKGASIVYLPKGRWLDLEEFMTEIQCHPESEWESLARSAAERRPELGDELFRLVEELRIVVASAEEEDGAGLVAGGFVGPYKLVRRLGRGATSCVWEATHRDHGQRVALKVFDAGGLDNDEAWRRALGEARAVKQLESFPREQGDEDSFRHIVRVYEVGQDSRFHYLAMECCREIIDDDEEIAKDASRHLPADLDEALMWMEQIARGVALAHRAGVYHRDLKPQNILVLPSGVAAKVGDFGLLQTHFLRASDPCARTDEETSAHRASGDEENSLFIAGTLAYMAPEAARGTPQHLDSSRKEDVELLTGIDIYGLGALFYFFLTGRPPHTRDHRRSDQDYLRQIQSAAVPSLRSPRFRIPRRVEDVVRKCLEHHRVDRYRSAAEVAQECRRLRLNLPTSLERGRIRRLWLWIHRNRLLALLVVAWLATVGIGTLNILWLLDEAAALGDKIDYQRSVEVRLQDLNEQPVIERGEAEGSPAPSEVERATVLQDDVVGDMAPPPAIAEQRDSGAPKRSRARPKAPSVSLPGEEPERLRIEASEIKRAYEEEQSQLKLDLERSRRELEQSRRENERKKRELERVNSLVVYISTGTDHYGGTDDAITLRLAGKAWSLENRDGNAFERGHETRFELPLAGRGLTLRSFDGDLQIEKSPDTPPRGGWKFTGIRIEVNGVVIYDKYVGQWLQDKELVWTGHLPQNVVRMFNLGG